MWKCRLYEPIHRDVWFDKRRFALCVDANDIAKSADINNVLFEIWARTVCGPVGYSEGLFAREIVLDFRRDLRDDALMAVHVEE
jgi:hypothetical protein